MYFVRFKLNMVLKGSSPCKIKRQLIGDIRIKVQILPLFYKKNNIMIKKIIIIILGGILPFLLLYIVLGYINDEFNPMVWESKLRAVHSLVAISISALGLGYYFSD